MSDHNLDTVSKLFDAWQRRDVEAMLEHLSTDVQWRPTPFTARRSLYAGHAGVREWAQKVMGTTIGLRIQTDEIRAVGGRVLVLGKAIQREPRTGEFAIEVGWLFELSDGRIVRGDGYAGWDESRRAAEAESPDRVEEPRLR